MECNSSSRRLLLATHWSSSCVCRADAAQGESAARGKGERDGDAGRIYTYSCTCAAGGSRMCILQQRNGRQQCVCVHARDKEIRLV